MGNCLGGGKGADYDPTDVVDYTKARAPPSPERTVATDASADSNEVQERNATTKAVPSEVQAPKSKTKSSPQKPTKDVPSEVHAPKSKTKPTPSKPTPPPKPDSFSPVVILLHPVTKRFELLRLTVKSEATASDVLSQAAESTTEEFLKKQTYKSLAFRNGKVIDSRAKARTFASENVLLAIPHDPWVPVSVEECTRLSDRILGTPEVQSLFAEEKAAPSNGDSRRQKKDKAPRGRNKKKKPLFFVVAAGLFARFLYVAMKSGTADGGCLGFSGLISSMPASLITGMLKDNGVIGALPIAN